MNGNEVYKFATRQVPKVIKEALDAADMEVEDVDWLLLHQVSFFCAVLATLLHIECIHQQIMNLFFKILTYMPSISNFNSGKYSYHGDSCKQTWNTNGKGNYKSIQIWKY